MVDERRPIIVDASYEKLAEEYRGNDATRWVAGAALETEKVIRRKIRCDAKTLEGKEAADYLSELIPLAVAETVRLHSAYGRLRWLWYLRRAPSELFEGEYSTTLGYDRSLAEAVSWHMPDSEVHQDRPWIEYPIDRSAYRRLCQYIGRIKLISSLHIMYRRVGKGARLDLSGPHLRANNETTTDQAIEVYDRRHEGEKTLMGRGYGLSPEPFDLERMKALAPERVPPLFLFTPCRPVELPIDHRIAGKEPQQCLIQARHVPWTVDPRSILDPLEIGDDWEKLVLRPYASAIQLSMALPLFFDEVEWSLGNCLKTGYFVTSVKRAEHLLDRALPEINGILSGWFPTGKWPETYAQWREAAFGLMPNTWPLQAGGFVRPAGEESVIIDPVALTLALDRGLGVDRSHSLIANIRADLFEQQCQEIIDRSPWKPSAELASLRGKTLRRRGVHLTDIDAIGTVGDTLLCVSCKSLVYDAAYDRGDFNVVRNAQQTVDDAVERWKMLIDDFHENPKGDNFDFSGFSKIIGVVCTPFVVYTDSPVSLEEPVRGLRACVSVNELKAWLKPK